MKKKQILLAEIIVWLLIILCGTLFFIYKTTIKDNVQNTYYMFFDDVEGLMRGSPVRLMGMNIGHIKDVVIIGNKVFVSILVTQKDMIIPKSATATIEFYGLGGSTSLELNPITSSNEEGKEEIIASDSYRVQDYWDGSKLSAEVMIAIYDNIGKSINDSGILNKKDNLKQSAFINNLVKQTNMANKSQTVIINKMTENTKKMIKEELNAGSKN